MCEVEVMTKTAFPDNVKNKEVSDLVKLANLPTTALVQPIQAIQPIRSFPHPLLVKLENVSKFTLINSLNEEKTKSVLDETKVQRLRKLATIKIFTERLMSMHQCLIFYKNRDDRWRPFYNRVRTLDDQTPIYPGSVFMDIHSCGNNIVDEYFVAEYVELKKHIQHLLTEKTTLVDVLPNEVQKLDPNSFLMFPDDLEKSE